MVFETLNQLGISYTVYEHEAVFTVDEAGVLHEEIPGAHTKNLFLRNKDGNRLYLVVIVSHKRADLAALQGHLLEQKLSFGSPELLQEVLGLTPGSVSPMGLINDRDHRVQVIVDEELFEYDVITFHPNVNTSTIAVNRDDFKKFLDWTGNLFQIRRL